MDFVKFNTNVNETMYNLRKRKTGSVFTQNLGGSVEKFKKKADKVNKIKVNKVDRPELAKHDSKLLDLAFAMDCTASMGFVLIRREIISVKSWRKSLRVKKVKYD